MNNKAILNKVKELLGMEVKLEQRKLEDGVTVIEAESFEAGAEVMIVTEDEQMIPLSCRRVRYGRWRTSFSSY